MRNQEQVRTSIFPQALAVPAFVVGLLALSVGCATPDPTSVDRARTALEEARETGLVGSDSLDFRGRAPSRGRGGDACRRGYTGVD